MLPQLEMQWTGGAVPMPIKKHHHSRGKDMLGRCVTMATTRLSLVRVNRQQWRRSAFRQKSEVSGLRLT